MNGCLSFYLVLHWTVSLSSVSLQNFLHFPDWYTNKHFKLLEGLWFCSFACLKCNNLHVYIDMRSILLLISYNVIFEMHSFLFHHYILELKDKG